MEIQFTQYSKIESPKPVYKSIYRLYDINNNEIPVSDWTISGLENAYYYTKGTDDTTKKRVGGKIFYINGNILEQITVDKFYVYDTTKGLQNSLVWGNVGKTYNCTTNTIGSGKINSLLVLEDLGNIKGTIWYFIKNEMNVNLVGGCDDWYIGSTLENNQLKTSGLQSDWFSSNCIWSSVEQQLEPGIVALSWLSNSGYWDFTNKNNSNCCFAIRSF